MAMFSRWWLGSGAAVPSVIAAAGQVQSPNWSKNPSIGRELMADLDFVNQGLFHRDSPILVALTVDVDDTTVLGEKRQTKYATTHRPRHVAPAGPDRWSAGYVH